METVAQLAKIFVFFLYMLKEEFLLEKNATVYCLKADESR